MGAEAVAQLPHLIEEAPYCATYRLLYLVALANVHSTRLRDEVKANAPFLPDRLQLFRMINHGEYGWVNLMQQIEAQRSQQPEVNDFELIDRFLDNLELGAGASLEYSLEDMPDLQTERDEQDDLISIGTIGLIKGISSYRPEKGTRLATYAARCVENEILMYFRARKKLQSEVSLNESIDTDKDGNSLYLMDIVGVDDTMYADIQDRDDSILIRRLVRECLTEREAQIISLRYGLGGAAPRTQREIATQLGISRSYVSRIEKRALEKLEEALGGRRRE